MGMAVDHAYHSYHVGPISYGDADRSSDLGLQIPFTVLVKLQNNYLVSCHSGVTIEKHYKLYLCPLYLTGHRSRTSQRGQKFRKLTGMFLTSFSACSVPERYLKGCCKMHSGWSLWGDTDLQVQLKYCLVLCACFMVTTNSLRGHFKMCWTNPWVLGL